MDARTVQTRLKALGFYQGRIDGDFGPLSLAAVSSALDKIAPEVTPAATVKANAVLDAWMPPANMARVIFHWTAGTWNATSFDRKHYHILINGDGTVLRGTPSIAANAPGGSGTRASHTLNCNTGSIGVSMACMAGAVERPLNAGKYPLTPEQWRQCSSVIADLCRRYKIPVTPKTVISHAEVQDNLGIVQRGKWDVAILPFDRSFNTAKKCGDRMRAEVTAKLN